MWLPILLPWSRETIYNLKPDSIYYLLFQVVFRSLKNKTLTGFSTIISAMGRESKSNTFSSSNLVTQCSIMQWFDYAVLFVIPAISSKSSIESVLQVKFKILEQNDSILFDFDFFFRFFNSGVEWLPVTTLVFGWK